MQYAKLLLLCLLDVTNLTVVAHFRLGCLQSVSNYSVKAQPDAGLRHPPREAGLGDEEWGPGKLRPRVRQPLLLR